MASPRTWHRSLHWIDRFALHMALVGAATLASAFARPEQQEVRDSLSGGLYIARVTGAKPERIRATGCLSGIERGFEGLVFQFPATSPIREVWVDTAREGDNVVVAHYADTTRSPLSIDEADCEFMRGSHEVNRSFYEGRERHSLRGYTRFSCKNAAGLEGSFSFVGCRSPSENDSAAAR